VLTNPRSDRVKAVRALTRRAVRSREGLFLAEGPQSVREVVRHRPELVRDLYHVADAATRHADVLAAALAAGLHVHEVTPEVLAADGSGTDLLHDIDLTTPHAWVMGNEAWGLEPEVREACDQVVRVPIYGSAESLNLAMAATVCLYTSATVQRRGRRSG
jgi:tRNA G18 (ribose-2'-O)-methylase SpoU